MAAIRIEGKAQGTEGFGTMAATNTAACYCGQDYPGAACLRPHSKVRREEGIQGSFDFDAAENPIAENRADKPITNQESDLYYRVIAETMTEGALILSPQGAILYCNRGFSRMVAVPPERLVGAPFLRLVVEEDRALFQDVLEKSARGQAEADVIHLSGNGGDLAVHLSGSVRVVDNNTVIFCIVVTDITKRVQAEDTLKQAKDRLEQTQ